MKRALAGVGVTALGAAVGSVFGGPLGAAIGAGFGSAWCSFRNWRGFGSVRMIAPPKVDTTPVRRGR